jgi:signal peptidase II
LNTSAPKRWALFLALAIGICTVDQITKALVTENLALGESWTPIPALAPIFKITHSANSGAAFSLFQGNNLPLLLLALGMLIGIIWFYAHTKPEERLQRLSLAILAGGVLGNLTDRIRFGTVVDFIHWQIPGVVSNVSNLADHAIVFAVFGLLLASRQTVRYASAHETSAASSDFTPPSPIPTAPDSVRNSDPRA